jgi:c-di-GMP-related signal transduction protein
VDKNNNYQYLTTASVFRGFADNTSVATHPPVHGSVEDKSVPKPASRFVARQPILTSDEKIFGYELLFRDGLRDYVAIDDSVNASRSTLDITTLMGLDVLCDGRRAFINCTHDDLLKDYVTLFAPANTVVEVLETVAPDESVVAACQFLKRAGYLIALDDFEVNDPREPLASLADIIKVDVRATSPEQSAAMVKRYKHPGCRMLAEKVETRDEFVVAEKAGFEYFQGYFFRKPEVLATRQMPANRVNYLRLLQAAASPGLNEREIEKVVKSDASFCYRLLRYLNSARFGFSNDIHSVRHALSMLGEYETVRWIRMVALFGAGQGKSSDLILAALVRARFCELMAPAIQQGGSDLFLMGLISLMDSILEMPMARVLESVPIAQESKAALLCEPSRLRPLYLVTLAMEGGEWHNVNALAKQFHMSETEVAEHYWQAMRWARQVSTER